MMIFKRRLTVAFFVICCVAFATSDNFKTSTEDLQVVFSDPSVSVMKPPSRYMYAKEAKQCPPGESKMMLTLLLKSLHWSNVSEKKKEKAIKKLSRFFLIPKQFITVDDTHSPQILEMLKHSINKSNSFLNAKESVGRMEFMIGCGDKMFDNGKTIAHQINEQVETGVLDELSGLPFGYWNIWTKQVKSRVQRTKRQLEGSGNDGGESGDENDEDYYDEGLDDNEEVILPEPASTRATPIQHKNKMKTKIHDEPSSNNEQDVKEEDDDDELKENNKFEEEGERKVQESQIINLEISQAPAVELPTEENEPITQRIIPIDVPTPIDPIENFKLETIVNKTIVNDNNVFEVPLVDEKDQYLEEVEKNFVTVTEPTIHTEAAIEYETKLTTHQTQPDESEVEIPTTKFTTIATTIFDEVEHESNIVSVTSPSSSEETETVFVAPNEPTNNEVVNNNLERLSIETTITPASTVTNKVVEESMTTTTPRDDNDESDIVIEEETSTAASTTTATTQSQTETEIEIQTSSFIPPIISTFSPTIEILTTEFLPTTSTISIVDVTHAVSDKASTTASGVVSRKSDKGETPVDGNETNYDDEYDDDDENKVDDVRNVATRRPTTARISTTEDSSRASNPTNDDSDYEDVESSSVASTLTTARSYSTIATDEEVNPSNANESDYDDDDLDGNSIPYVDKRIPKTAAVAGKPFSFTIADDVFVDAEDKTNLTLELLDKNGKQIEKLNSWIQFNKEKREIYGLPLDSDVSKHEYKVRATDHGGLHVDENIEITVQQFRGSRSTNHEIYLPIKLEKNYTSNVDWEIRLIRAIVETLDDDSTGSIVVREIRPNKHDLNYHTFVYTNDSLPKDHCPKDELEALMARLNKQKLTVALEREILVRDVKSDQVGNCQERSTVRPIQGIIKNYPPTTRNQIDKIKASIGQLLVFPVPIDTFYDPEDLDDTKLSLFHENRGPIEAEHWLQFDSRNREFFGVPDIRDINNQTYILVAEDKEGLKTNDALVVEIDIGYRNEDLSVNFNYLLDMPNHQFKQAATMRKFIETIATVFGDRDTSNIMIGKIVERSEKRTLVEVRNTTLQYEKFKTCPNSRIEKLRNVLVYSDGSIRSDVKDAFGEIPVLKINTTPIKKCGSFDSGSYHHPEETTLLPENTPPLITNDLLVTYILPTGIILVMLILFFLLACYLHKRKNTGKMELGDEEERKSFRSKGIPVIFQDELEEKPEISTKSPIIMKDEKPPLLPQYNGVNHDDDENVDQYIPPQPLLMGNRESRGKSPVTPSYRKPPPYVSP